MELESHPRLEITEDLLEAIRSFPTEREVEHCGAHIRVSPFEFYSQCPRCGTRIKLRSFTGGGEIEDIFDAVFEWMNQPTAKEVSERRRLALEDEE